MNTPQSLSPHFCQPELNLRQKSARAVNRDSVEELCGLLRGREWTTARDLQRLRPLWSERFIRLLANASEGRVLSYPGSPGYRLAEGAEIAEIAHASAALIAQGKDMWRRGIIFRRLAGLRRAEEAITQPS